MSLFKRKKTEDQKKDEQMKKAGWSEVGAKNKSFTKKKADSKAADKKTEKIVKDDKGGGKSHGRAYRYLIRPVISEKVSYLGTYNQYVFEVAPNANKVEIKKAFESLYGVKPVKINIINMRGKRVSYGRNFGYLKKWKKAVVTLKPGDKVDVYEGV